MSAIAHKAPRLSSLVQACAFVLVPAVFAIGVLSLGATGAATYGLEFRGNLWEPAGRILDGESPYELERLERALLPSSPESQRGYFAQAVYPAAAHVAAIPFGLMPFKLAMAIFVAISIGAVAGALWISGVRDYRCFGTAFLSVPVVHAIKLGGLTPLLLLGAAVVWHYRDRRWAPAVAAAALIACKLFLWPLIVFLWAAKGWSVAGRALAFTAGVLVAGWGVIAFRGLIDYPRLLELLADGLEGTGYSVPTVVGQFGFAPQTGRSASAILGTLLLVASIWFARRRGDERASLTFALVAALAYSPIVWQQYFILLLLPVAVYAPRLALAWVIPLAFWLAPVEGHAPIDLLVAWTSVGMVLALALFRSRAVPAFPGSTSQTPAVATPRRARDA